MKKLQSKIRTLGYQLACREIYGENTPAYFELKREHSALLHKFYNLKLNKAK